MRVLLVFTTSAIGGAERSLTRLAACANQGSRATFTVVTLGGDGPLIPWSADQGVVISPLGRSDPSGIAPIALWRLLRRARTERPEIVYIIGIRASLWIRLLRPWLPHCRLVHGIRMNYVAGAPGAALLNGVERHLGFLVDGYIANSRAAADELRLRAGVDEKKLRVAYNGIPLPAAAGATPVAEVRVITVANLSERKNHIAYLDAIEIVLRRRPEVRFQFVGRDESAGAVAAAVKARGLQDRVELLGYQSSTGPLIAAATLFALPSLHEGMPTAILESMALGVPAVAFATDGVPELVDSGRTGWLVERGRMDLLAAAILRLLDDADLRQRLGSAAAAHVREHFSLDSAARAHLDCLESFLATRRAAP